MKENAVFICILALGGLFAAGASAQQSSLPDPVTVREAEGFFRVFTPESFHTNIGVLAGPEGLLLVDTGHTPRTLDRLRKALGALSPLPVRFIIHTHDHADHRAGDALVDEAAVMIDKSALDGLAGRGILKGPVLPEKDGPVLFGPYYLLRFNDEEIRIFPAGGVHSGEDVLIHVPGKSLLQTGDLFLSQCFPATSYVDGYMAFLDRTIASFPEVTRFIPGHGRSVDRQGFKAYRDMLARMIGMVAAAKAAGRSLDVLLQPDNLEEFRSWHSLLDWLGPESWVKSIYASR